MTTRRLVLIRHAKTEQAPPRPELGDHGRELMARGRADAQAGGRWLAGEGLLPDLVLCSTAARTRQTWEAMVGGAPELGGAEVWHDRRIYQGDPEDLQAALADVPQKVGTLALVGHAPGVPALVADLTDTRQTEQGVLASLARGFPTMTCAVLEVDGAWPDIPPFGARLTTVHTPRREQ